MKATLVRFGQEVSLDAPDKSINTLIFDIDGRPFSVPVPAETIAALVMEIEHRKAAQRPAALPPPPATHPSEEEQPSEEDLQHAEQFGGTEETSEPSTSSLDACPNCGNEEYEQGGLCGQCGYFDGPDSEDEVAPL